MYHPVRRALDRIAAPYPGADLIVATHGGAAAWGPRGQTAKMAPWASTAWAPSSSNQRPPSAR